jgi:uncharacterized membrane protein (UPF0127 family)
MTTIQIGNKFPGVKAQEFVRGLALVDATLKLDPYWAWYVKVAYESTDLQQGLSGVASLPPANGMFFDTGAMQQITVDCTRMLFPLGIVFFNNSLVVTETMGASYQVSEGIQPGQKVTSAGPARFFLECNPNEVVGITPGLVAVLEGYTPPAPATPGTIVENMMPMMMMAMMVPVIGKMV